MASAIRLAFLTLAIVAATVALGTRAGAQNYPWCAIYSMADSPHNCGFVSSEQCMQTVRGMGGFCMPNNLYQLPDPAARRSGRQYSHGQS